MIKTAKHFKIINILLIFLSVALSLILLEIYFIVFDPQKLYFNITKWDQYVGFVNMPNIEGRSITKEFNMLVKINSHGLRDREISYEKPCNTIRIGVFGDSFTFGEGVQNNETYPKVLEKLLRNELIKDNCNVEVINFGIGKTGTSHQLAFFQREGKKYNLDIVLVGFLAGNDFSDNLRGVFILENGQLKHNPTAYSTIRRIQKIVYLLPFYRWLAENSHLINFIRKVATIIDDNIRTRKSISLNISQKELEDQAKIVEKELDITKILVETFNAEADRSKSLFILINIPAKGQKEISNYSKDEDIPMYILQNKALLDFMKNKHISYVDLVPYFDKIDRSLYYFKHDGHMNQKGNELIAKIIRPDINALIKKITRVNTVRHDN